MYAATYIWAKVIGYLEKEGSDIIVGDWLKDTEIVELKDNQLILYSPSDFHQKIIRERCAPYIQEALEELFQIKAKLLVWGDSELNGFLKTQKEMDTTSFPPQFTFESFVPGPSNQIVMKIAQAVANDPGAGMYNPLLIYGPPGVGKTHLQYAIANHIRKVHPEKNVVYIRGEQFTNELISAICNGTTRKFKQKYRHDVDVLLIDDLQFIAGKESSQEEFYHIIDELYENKKQIVMTADRQPCNIITMEDWLRERIEGGIMVGISPPDPDTRDAIIRAKHPIRS